MDLIEFTGLIESRKFMDLIKLTEFIRFIGSMLSIKDRTSTNVMHMNRAVQLAGVYRLRALMQLIACVKTRQDNEPTILKENIRII